MRSAPDNRLRAVDRADDGAPPSDLALRHFLQPLAPWLEDVSLTEICVNTPGEVWTEGANGWRRHDCPALSFEACKHLAQLLAAYGSQRVGPAEPVLSGTLPTGHRCQVLLPPAVLPNSVSLTIRAHSQCDFTLWDYEGQGAFERCADHGAGDLMPHERQLLELKRAHRIREFLELAVKERQNILLSGATGSGKTTFMKALVRAIPQEERLLSIENVDELRLRRSHPNSVAMFYSGGGQGLARVEPRQLMHSALRMKPDRVLLAELITGDDAFYYLRNVNSGHPGSITSMHAPSARLAAEQLVLFVKESEAGHSLDRDDIKHLVFMAVDVIVQWKAIAGRRVVTEVYYDPMGKRKYLA